MIFNYLFLMAPAGSQGGGFSTLFLFGSMFIIMYFFMIRPQMKKAKEQEAFILSLTKGENIVTLGGIHGKIVKVNDDNTFMVEIDEDIIIKLEKTAISPEVTKALKTRNQTASTNKA